MKSPRINIHTFSASLVSLALLTTLQSANVHSVEPMSESDMGNISAESGNVLNIMGAPASGGSQNASPKTKSLEQAATSVNYIEVDPHLESQAQVSKATSSVDTKGSISTFKVSERTNGLHGNTTLYYDEKNNQTSSSATDDVLTISQDVKIQQVLIQQARHSAESPVRGNYSFGGVQVNSAVSISTR